MSILWTLVVITSIFKGKIQHRRYGVQDLGSMETCIALDAKKFFPRSLGSFFVKECARARKAKLKEFCF
jgi:hypothetical protein